MITVIWCRKSMIWKKIINRPLVSMMKVFVILTTLFIFSPLMLRCQTVESAREKFLAGNYEEAESEIKSVLEKEKGNIEAENLLLEIERARKKKQSFLLTKKALLEIENRNFEEAYNLLKEAIIQDPENEEARKLYLSIHEIAEIEKKSLENIIKEEVSKSKITEEVQIAKKIETQGEVGVEVSAETQEKSKSKEAEINKPGEIEPAEKVEQPKKIEPARPVEKIIPPEKPEPGKPKKRRNHAYIQVTSAYTVANSNNLDYVNSKVSLLGGDVFGYYYFNFLKEHVGISTNYSISFLKLKGEDVVDFLVQRVNASVRYRAFLFEKDENLKLTVGAMLGYNLFSLHSKTEYGVYKFTTLYSPGFGFFISDPVIYRFIKNKIFENLGFEGELNFVYLFRKGAPYSLDIYSGAYYDVARYRISLGFNTEIIKDREVHERYNNIQIGSGYRF